ncbi:MAG: THO complex subunit 2 [Caeruleum heppii]|nr:MAG: THO complex subunit 2 [Caeruleum heppii]
MAPGKRKRGDRNYNYDPSNDGSQRPSPHRPGNTSLGQQSRDQEFRNRGGRRGSYHGRGGGGPRYDGRNTTSPAEDTSAIPSGIISAMSPPTVAPPRTPQEPARTSAPSVQPEPPTLIPPPNFQWDYLTEETIAAWSEAGMTSTIDAGVQAQGDMIALGAIFQELTKSAIYRRIDPTQAGNAVKDILQGVSASPAEEEKASTHPAMHLFLDTLSIVTETDPLTPALATFIEASNVPAELLRQYLEAPLLETLGMIRSTFPRMSIRKTTNLLYRQSNYNLLREETEGYSKLITELFSTSNNEPPTSEVVEETFERVKALIGAFDLDVGRVLDVTLDVFASVLVKQFRFFVKLLRASSWWPKEQDLNGLRVYEMNSQNLPAWALPGSSTWQSNDEDRTNLLELRTARDTAFWQRAREVGLKAFCELNAPRVASDETSVFSLDGSRTGVLDHDWIQLTGTLPPQGNRVAAQLLGFKLRFYASQARDPTDVLPANLIYLAALLIKIGFISLRDLYPHLWPADDAMEAVRQEKMKEKAEREKLNRPGGGASNALAMAGALSDDSIPAAGRLREGDGNRGTPITKIDAATDKTSTAAKAEEKEKLPEPADQKVQLLKSLLCIGALPEALFMLGRFPWLPDAFPDLPDYIHRILHHCLHVVYEPLRPLGAPDSLQQPKKIPDPDQSGVPKGSIRLAELPARRVLRWALPDLEDASEAVDYRFYWDEWADNIPMCQNVDDVFTLCRTLLNFSGVKIGKDPTLLLKLTRIGKKSLADDPSDTNTARWVDLCKRLLVPSLSLTKTNPGVVNEVYDLLRHFSTSTRYSIYAEWYSGSISRLPDIKVAFEQAKAETKDVLKRISKTNVKLMARALAKVAYPSPGIVFSVAIGQIEAYDNLVEVVVECARYFTFLGYDVLTWSLMSSLGAKGRNRVQADGMLTSKWLAALSLFAGKVFKRYSSLMNPTPILQYVTDQLRKNNSVDLIVLKEITTHMAGIVPDTNLNESQILAMAGGELLRQQTLLQILDKRTESRGAAKRLIRSLTDPKLAGQLLICIAQVMQTCIFGLPENDSHLKLLGNLFDEIHRVLAQYLDLLRSNLTVAEFESLVPDAADLIHQHGIEPAVAFWISRPTIAANLEEADDNAAKARQIEAVAESVEKKTDADGDVGMTDEPAKVEADKGDPDEGQSSSQVVIAGETDQDISMDNALESSKPPTEIPDEGSLVVDPWHPVLKTVMDKMRPVLPEDTWSKLSLSFYVTFWQLSLYDIHVPVKSYEEEIKRLKSRYMAVRDDRSDMSYSANQKKEKEKKHLTEMQARLPVEMKAHIQAFSEVRTRLAKEKDHWFAGFWGKFDTLNDALIQYCLLPRLLISPHDALFCFRIIKTLHAAGTPNFRTMGLIDRILRESRLANIIFICTSQEAENLGRFLNELLKDLSRWHADKAVYEKEAFGTKRELPGYAKRLVQGQPPEHFMEYEDFRRLMYKWHKNLHAALKACLTSGEYMHIRNAIIVLKGIHQHFPVVNWIGTQQVASVTELGRSEKREDLKIAATSLLGNLVRREKQWVLPQAFHIMDSSPNGARARLAKPTTPQPDSEAATALRPSAPEFQPQSQPNGLSSSQVSTTNADVDVGEVKDGDKSSSADRAPSNPLEEDTLLSKSEDKPQQMHFPDRADTSSAVQPTKSRDESGDGPRNEREDGSQQTPSAPAATKPDGKIDPPQGPARPEPSRNPSTTSNATRATHSLPSRPEPYSPYPPRGSDRRLPDRQGDRGSGPNARFSDAPRFNRPGEHPHEHQHDRRLPGTAPVVTGRDRFGNDRAAKPEYDGREFNRPGSHDYERGHRALPNDRFGPPVDRDGRDTVSNGERDNRQPRDLLYGRDGPSGGRASDAPSPGSRESSMGPPKSIIPAHPDRAALIQGDLDRPRGSEREARSERPSRPQSPRRSEDRPPRRFDGRAEMMRDDRLDRPPASDHNSGRLRPDESQPPTGPRGGRTSTSANPEPAPPVDRARDHFGNGAPSGRLGGSHGDHNGFDARPPPRHQDLSYGRLNASSDVPSGPRRNVGGRGGRIASSPQAQPNARLTETNAEAPLPSPSLSDRPPPTGPSSGRGRIESHPPDTGPALSASSSAPPTPVVESGSNDLAGVHPDRLRGLQGPSSAGNFPRPSLPQAEFNGPSENAQQLSSGGAPAGPRTTQPNGPSPVEVRNNSPMGPGMAADRGRGDKRFAGIQNMLQQSGSPSNGSSRDERGTSIRGRATRSSGMTNLPSAGGDGPPGSATAFDERPDLTMGRIGGPLAPHPQTDDDRHGWPHDEGPGRDNEPRRSSRHHTSRDHSRDDRDAPFRRDDDRMGMPPRPRDDPRGDRRTGSSRSDERDSRRLPRDDGGDVGGRDRERRDGRDRDRRNGRDREGRDAFDGGRAGPADLPPHPLSSAASSNHPPPWNNGPPTSGPDRRGIDRRGIDDTQDREGGSRRGSGRDGHGRDSRDGHGGRDAGRDGRKRGRGGDDLMVGGGVGLGGAGGGGGGGMGPGGSHGMRGGDGHDGKRLRRGP